MSLYADYLREKTSDEIVETASGFATYRFTDEKTVYIVDIYVVPKARMLSVASDIADKIVEYAKSRGCNRLLGSVVPSNKKSTESLQVLLSYGFQLHSSSNDFILFSKDIS